MNNRLYTVCAISFNSLVPIRCAQFHSFEKLVAKGIIGAPVRWSVLQKENYVKDRNAASSHRTARKKTYRLPFSWLHKVSCGLQWSRHSAELDCVEKVDHCYRSKSIRDKCTGSQKGLSEYDHFAAPAGERPSQCWDFCGIATSKAHNHERRTPSGSGRLDRGQP
jgi:hypothetical protein